MFVVLFEDQGMGVVKLKRGSYMIQERKKVGCIKKKHAAQNLTTTTCSANTHTNEHFLTTMFPSRKAGEEGVGSPGGTTACNQSESKGREGVMRHDDGST
jgi:hypothetical protein